MTAPDAVADAVDPRLSRFEAESPGAARLAELASLAVRVDTGLLRRLRQTLLPDTDVGAESDLWFSAIVEARSETGFQIAPEITSQLRDRLKSMPDRPSVAAVRAILREAHATVSPAIRLEEEINGIALELGDAGREAIDEALRAALATLARGGPAATDVGRWAMLAIPRLHPIVRDTKNARTLIAAASLLLRRRVRFSAEAPEPDVRISTLGWAVSGTPRSQRIGVEFVPGGLQFRGSVETAAGFIEVPITDPVMVEIEWESPSGPRHRLTQAGDGVLVPLDGEPPAVTITTLLGDQFRVTSVIDGGQVAQRERPPATSAAHETSEPRPVHVYCVYAHEDKKLEQELEMHLKVLTRQGRIELWTDRQIPAGTEWTSAIAEQLERAEIILFLVSASFLASDYINSVELPRALERAESGAARVIPILLRPTDWSSSPLGRFQALPKKAKPITTFRSRDAGWVEVVRGIEQVVEQIQQEVAAEARPRRVVMPPDVLLAACVQIEPLGRAEAIGVAFAVEPSLLIGVRDNIEPLPIVGVHGDERQLQVIPLSAAGDIAVLRSDTGLVGLRPVGSRGTVYATTLPPATRTDVEALRAAAAGFVDEEAKWFDVALESHVAGGQARGVLFDPPDLSQEELEAAFVGAPLVVNERTVGVIVGVTRPQGHDTYATIEFVDGAHLRQVVDRAERPTVDESPRPSERTSIDITELLLPAIVRDAIAELLRSQGPPILLITGPRQSPLDEVVRWIERKGDTDFERTIVELASGRDLTQEIAVSAGLSVDKMPSFGGSSYLRFAWDRAAWLVGALESTGVPRLLTIRGSEYNVAQQDVLDVVSQLIARIAESKGLLRLLLLNYTAPLPGAIESRIRRLTLEPVDRRDVQHFFTRLFEQTGRSFEGAAVEQATESVFAPFASADSWEYEELRNRLAEAAQALSLA